MNLLLNSTRHLRNKSCQFFIYSSRKLESRIFFPVHSVRQSCPVKSMAETFWEKKNYKPISLMNTDAKSFTFLQWKWQYGFILEMEINVIQYINGTKRKIIWSSEDVWKNFWHSFLIKILIKLGIEVFPHSENVYLWKN